MSSFLVADELSYLDPNSASQSILEKMQRFCLPKWLQYAKNQLYKGCFSEARESLGRLFKKSEEVGCETTVKNEALGVLAAVFASEGNWRKTEETLEQMETIALTGRYACEAMHMLARANLNNNSFQNALHWGSQAHYWRMQLLSSTKEPDSSNQPKLSHELSENELLYYLSSNLMKEIFEKQGDPASAVPFKVDLPPDFYGNCI